MRGQQGWDLCKARLHTNIDRREGTSIPVPSAAGKVWIRSSELCRVLSQCTWR